LTRPEEIILTRTEKIEKFDIFRGNFPNSNPNHRWLTQSDPSHKKFKKLTRPGSKNFNPDPSLQFTITRKRLKSTKIDFEKASFNFDIEEFGWRLQSTILQQQT